MDEVRYRQAHAAPRFYPIRFKVLIRLDSVVRHHGLADRFRPKAAESVSRAPWAGV